MGCLMGKQQGAGKRLQVTGGMEDGLDKGEADYRTRNGKQEY